MYEYLRRRLFASKSLAPLIDTSECQLYRWAGEGKIVVVRLGPRCTRFVGDSVADFLERRQSVPSQPRGKAAHHPKKLEGVADAHQTPAKSNSVRMRKRQAGIDLDKDQSGVDEDDADSDG